MLTERQLTILKAIIESFINSAEPVGSKTLMQEYDLPYSSATIRNEMAFLESAGYLEKTHISSGRIPSAQGYKYYVSYLMDKQVDKKNQMQLQTVFNDQSSRLQDVIKESCDILSQLTNLTSIGLGPGSEFERLQNISLVPIDEHSVTAVIVTSQGHVESKYFHLDKDISMENLSTCVNVLNELLIGTIIDTIPQKLEVEIKPILEMKVKQYEILFMAFMQAFAKFVNNNVYYSGTANMLYQPEFADIEKIKRLMNIMSNQDFFNQLTHTDDGLNIQIGSENLIQMDDVTVISSTYHLSDEEKGTIAIIGPTRMDYDKVVGLIEFVSRSIEEKYRK